MACWHQYAVAGDGHHHNRHWARLELGVAISIGVIRKGWGQGGHCCCCCHQAKLGQRKKLKEKKAHLLVLVYWH